MRPIWFFLWSPFHHQETKTYVSLILWRQSQYFTLMMMLLTRPVKRIMIVRPMVHWRTTISVPLLAHQTSGNTRSHCHQLQVHKHLIRCSYMLSVFKQIKFRKARSDESLNFFHFYPDSISGYLTLTPWQCPIKGMTYPYFIKWSVTPYHILEFILIGFLSHKTSTTMNPNSDQTNQQQLNWSHMLRWVSPVEKFGMEQII